MRNISDKIFRKKKIKTHFIFSKFFPKYFCVGDNVEKYCRARQVAGGDILLRKYLAKIQKHIHDV